MAEQPTREQFDAAAKKVLETAPPGLSRDQFFALIELELTGAVPPATPLQAMSGPKSFNDTPEHEPDTYIGGFLKGLRDYYRPNANEMLLGMKHVAQPQQAKDFLPLLVPSGIEGAISGARGMYNRVADAAKVAPRVRDIPKVMGQLSNENIAVGGRGHRLWREMPLEEKMSSIPETPAPVTGRAAGPLATGAETPTPFNELPLYKQMEQMPETAAPARGKVSGPPNTKIGAETATPPPAPRLAGKAPTLEDELLRAMEDARAGDTELRSMMPESATTVGEGPLKQSGTFPEKVEGIPVKRGQPGGYSSGRPGLTQQQYDDLLDRVGGRGAAETPPLGTTDAPSVEGGGGSAPLASDEPTVALETYLQQLVEHDPGAMAGRAQELRLAKGSEDAAREMFGTGNPITKGWIRQMAPGPSRIPQEAEARIQEAIRRALEGEKR